MAIRTVYGEYLVTADGSSPNKYQKVIPGNNLLLRSVRSWVIQFANPTYTAVGMKLYTNNAGVPGVVLATSSTTWTKAAMFAAVAHGLTDVYFEFDYVPLKANETYHVALTVSGYTGSSSSHIAWMRSYPDPTYQTSVDMDFEGLLLSPMELVIIGAEL